MARFDKLIYPDSVSDETIDQRAIDEKIYPENEPINLLVDKLSPIASLDVTGKLPAMLNMLKNSKADISDRKAAWNPERNVEQMLDPNSPQSQMMFDMATSVPAIGMTRTVKEMVKKFGPEVGEIIGKELERKAANIYGSAHVDPYLSKAITKTGQMQRFFKPNDPEDAMLKAQKALGGGRLGESLEHIGDLPFTMTGTWGNNGDRLLSDVAKTKPFDIERAVGKVKGGNGLSNLLQKDWYGDGSVIGAHPLAEHADNLRSNFNYYQKNPDVSPIPMNEATTFADFEKSVKDAYQNYANAHKELPAYNEPFWQAREAAVNIGELNTDKAVQNLRRYLKVMDVPMESRLNAMSRAERTPNNTDLLRRLGMQYPENINRFKDNKVLQNILDWNNQKKFTEYINPHDEIIGDLNKIKAVIKQNPAEFDPTGNFKNVYSTNGKIIKKFRKDEYVPEDLLPSAIQEQINFNKMGDLNPNTKTYKTTKNIWQTQDKYTPMKNLAEDQYDIDNGRAIVEYLLKKKGLGPTDMHDTNFGGKLGGTYKVFDTGTFDNITNIDNSDIELLNKTFKTLPDDRADYLNELLKLKLEKK